MKLETERLILRSFCLSDLGDYWEYVSDEDVMLRANSSVCKDMVEARNALSNLSSTPNCFAIVLKSEKKVIGQIALTGGKVISYVLAQKYWGCGYMHEALSAAKKYAFEVLGVSELYAASFTTNVGSNKVLDKCGFKNIFTISDDISFVGALIGIAYYKMTSQDYFESIKYNR